MVIFLKVFFLFFALNVKCSKHVYETSFGEMRQHTCIFVVLCAACLPASLIMHVPISDIHAQWHWCLDFSMNLNSQRFLQFHPTVMSVAYVNSCFNIIRQNSFPVFFLAEWVKILVRSCAGFPSADIFPKQTSRMCGNVT